MDNAFAFASWSLAFEFVSGLPRFAMHEYSEEYLAASVSRTTQEVVTFHDNAGSCYLFI